MATQSFPQMTESAYFKVRDAFRKAMPSKVTPTWIMTSIDGYRSDNSARKLMRYLRQFGLLSADGAPTDIARQWRMDDGYSSACELMLRSAFPPDLVEAVAGGVPNSETLENLFMNHGVGLGSAKNISRVFLVLANKQLKAGKEAPKVVHGEVRSSKTRRSRPKEAERPEPSPAAVSAELSNAAVNTLRYFLDRGRLAELRIPHDISPRELKKLFRHLEIDLMEHSEDGA